MTAPSRPKVCYFGTYRAEYSRNQISIEGLRRAGAIVSICHEPLWINIEDRVQIASGGWLRPAFWRRILRCYWKLLRKYRTIGEYDFLIVGYPGQYDVFLARWLSWLRKKPLVWDIFNSMYLVMSERGISRRHRASASLVRGLEKAATRLPDLMLLDSQEFINWFLETYHLSGNNFRILPIGADRNELPEALNQAGNHPSKYPNRDFRVIYYGTYITNHGVGTIIEAASLLRNDPQVRFEMIGTGPEREKAERLAGEYRLENVSFIDWLEKPELAFHLSQASVCLGSLGDTLQSRLTNNNKIYEAFSMKIPVITGHSPALPENLIDRVHLYLCERGSPRALADAIFELQNDVTLRQSLANNGYQILVEKFDTSPLGQLFLGYLEDLQNVPIG